MNWWNKLFNDVYQGVYFYSIRYETKESAKSFLWFRARIIYYLYYVSIVILLIGIRVKTYGPFKPNVFEIILYGFILYFLLYKFFIDRSINKELLEKLISEEEKRKKTRRCIFIFTGSIFLFLISMITIYFIYKS